MLRNKYAHQTEKGQFALRKNMMHNFYLRVAGERPNVPSAEVLDWLGVHVGLLVRLVDAPHLDHSFDLGHGQIKGSAAEHFPNSFKLLKLI